MAALFAETSQLFNYMVLHAENRFRLEGHVAQNKNAQDFEYTGYTKNGKEFMVVCDGHGKGNIISCLRKLDWVDIMSSSNTPIETIKTILNTIEEYKPSRGDGSTITIMLMADNPTPGIRIWWIGDSSCRVYNNGIEIWRSTDHNSESEREKAMIKNKKIREEKAWDLSVIDDTTMTMKISSYFHFGDYIDNGIIKEEKINMTRALGHGGSCNQEEETHFIPFDKALSPSLWRVVMGSDGLWDMICNQDTPFISAESTSANDLSDFVIRRWTQKWKYVCPVNKTVVLDKTIPSRDDVAVTIFQNII